MRTGDVVRGEFPRLGFTLTELTVSVVVFGIVMAGAFSFLQVQNRGFREGLDYMASTQALRRAVRTLERDLQTAGTNLSPGQPEIVYASDDVLAFNSDYASGTGTDPFAVFFDPDLDDGVTLAWLKSQKETLPHSSFAYPDTTYTDGAGLPGPAETLIFFFEEDSETERRDDFALYRQVNAGEPQLVARNLLRVHGQPFFRYLTKSETGLDSIPDSVLPLAHELPGQENPADTGGGALADRIRGVRVTLAATDGREAEAERISRVTRIVRMPNMGFGGQDRCGSNPSLGIGLSASLNLSDFGRTRVDLAWERSRDDGQGENDIVRYVIWRRLAGAVDWEEPLFSIPAGKARYIYRDADLVAGETYEYALAAQDCTPALSSHAVSPPIKIPITRGFQ